MPQPDVGPRGQKSIFSYEVEVASQHHIRKANTMTPLSKPFYFAMVIVGGLIMFVVELWMSFLVYVFQEGRGADREVVPIIMAVSMLPLLFGVALDVLARTMLVYKMWAAIQGGTARTTPEYAAGFLFIPLFNLYWAFPAIWGWTQDFNRFVAEKGIAAPKMPENLALTICILWAVSALCFPLGACLGVVNFVLILMFMNSAINGVNAVIAGTPPAKM